MFRYARAGLVTIGLLAPSVVLADDNPSTNIKIIESQLAEMNRGDWKTALGVYTPDTRNFGRKVGRAVMARIFQDIYTTFPDFKQEIVEIVAVGDSVIVREKMKGTHDGVGRIPVNGGMLVGVAPTGRHYEADAIHWYKLKDGKITDHYAVRDDLKMMQDLRLSPEPAPFDWAAFAAEANTKR
jgi:predicted ester cyclase